MIFSINCYMLAYLPLLPYHFQCSPNEQRSFVTQNESLTNIGEVEPQTYEWHYCVLALFKRSKLLSGIHILTFVSFISCCLLERSAFFQFSISILGLAAGFSFLDPMNIADNLVCACVVESFFVLFLSLFFFLFEFAWRLHLWQTSVRLRM